MWYVVEDPTIIPVHSENGMHWNMCTDNPPKMTSFDPDCLYEQTKILEKALDEACDILGDDWCPRVRGLARLEECDNPEHDCFRTNSIECWRQYFLEKANKAVE